jgi:hypothetical protein
VRKTSWLGALVLSLLLVLSTAPTTTAAAAEDWDPTYRAQTGGTFNVPRPWGGSVTRYRIVEKIEEAIRNAAPGSTVLVTSYLMDRWPSVNALIGACERGVSVRVILDSAITNDKAKALIQTLNADNVAAPGDEPVTGPCNSALPQPPTPAEPDPTATTSPSATATPGTDEPTPLTKAEREEPLTDREALESVADPLDSPAEWGGDRSYVTQCQKACRSGASAMHSKFFVFSQTGQSRNVIMVSSSNLNGGGANFGWNDMLTLVDRPAAFAKYRAIHRSMTEEERAPTTVDQMEEGNALHRFYPLIGGTRANDPVLADLNRIQCASDLGRTVVHVQMFYWSKARGEYLADKVTALGRAGCRVKVIVGAPSRRVMNKLRTAAKRRKIQLWDSRVETRQNFQPDKIDVRTHSKSVLVKGTYGGDRSSHVVMMGSPNWTPGSLKYGDENTVTVRSVSDWTDFRDNFSVVRNHSRRIR